MANRRCLQPVTRYFQSIKCLTSISQSLASPNNVLYKTPTPKSIHHIFDDSCNIYPHSAIHRRHFSLRISDGDDNDIEEDEESEDEDGDENENEDGGDDIESVNESTCLLSAEDQVKDAAEIGYKVIGPLQPSERIFKPYEPVFAVVQIGSHQFKVSNRDTVYVERLKYCDVNDKVVLNKVLMLGSESQTIIGRPVLPEAAVHAVIEEHALDAKVIIFKKKRRKNYRRKNGHRQELTKLRITDIQGIEKPEKKTPLKTEKKEKPVKIIPLKAEKKEKPRKLAA